MRIVLIVQKLHPNQHTEQEIKLIKDKRKRNKHTGLVVFWVKLRQKGYSRSITGLWRMLRKLELAPIKPPNPKYIPKPCEKMNYPGQRVQIDVKFVPDICIVGDAKADGVSYRSGFYKMYMVRMIEISDELANVRVYKFDVQKCTYPVMGCL